MLKLNKEYVLSNTIGKYELISTLGQGGMSTIFLVEDSHLHKKWALKKIDLWRFSNGGSMGEKSNSNVSQSSNDNKMVEQLFGEAIRMKELSYPGLPLVVDVWTDETALYLVMEYIKGNTLQEIFNKKGTFSIKQTIDIMSKICQIIDYLHRQSPPIIYRDMKPSNIMIGKDSRVWLIDFGIARTFTSHKEEDTICLGTKGFAAPEQYGGMGQSNQRTDVFGIGITMYYLLTGKKLSEEPYKILEYKKLKHIMPKKLYEVIKKATSEDPKKRYSSVKQLMHAIVNYQKVFEISQKQVLFRTIALITQNLLIIVLIIFGFLFVSFREHQTKYHSLISQKKYEQAIELMPEKKEAYHEILFQTFLKDNLISEAEKETMYLLLQKAMMKLPKKDYAELCYENAKLIWYFYDAKFEERIIQAYPVFLEAKRNRLKSNEDLSIYIGIGFFYQEINPLVFKESYDKKEIIKYYQYLKELLLKMNQNSFEQYKGMNKEACNLIEISLQRYYKVFKESGISTSEMESFIDDFIKCSSKQMDIFDQKNLKKNLEQIRKEGRRGVYKKD